MLTVVTAATSRRLTTVEAVKATLGITGADQDAQIGALIDRASGMIASYCRRVFACERLRQRFERTYATTITLARFPVAVRSVSTDGAALGIDAWAVDSEAGLLERLGPGGCGRPWLGNATVAEYDAGYQLPGQAAVEGVPPLPADIEGACITLVSALRFSASRDPMLRSESTENVGSASWIASAEMGALPPQVADALAGYVAPPGA